MTFRHHEMQGLALILCALHVPFCMAAEATETAEIRDLDISSSVFKDAIVYTLENPMVGTPILPDSRLVTDRTTQHVRVIAARDEFESFSLAVQAGRDLKGITIAVTDLDHEQGHAVIPADAIDVRVVKCWYQAGSAWAGIVQDRARRFLTPELLLHDDALMRVDEKDKKNFLRLSFSDGARYWNTEDPKYNKTGRAILPVREFPVYDATVLQPLDLAKDRLKQYWLTLHVPPCATPGFYAGTITLREGKKDIGAIPLRVRVLPFVLPMPKTRYDPRTDFISSIYYLGKYDPTRHPDGSISSEWKTEQQLRAELIDMWQHNIHNPTLCQRTPGIATHMRLRNETGMKGFPLLSLGPGVGNPTKPERIRAMQKRVKRRRAIAEAYGAPETYVYGIDERTGDELLAQRTAWRAVHEVGVKMFVAGRKESFDLVGDLLDMHVQNNVPTREDAAKWHTIGHKIICYGNPQTGPEDPELFRRNFGLLLWLANYDGAMTYAYQHSFDNIYDDSDNDDYRDHVFSYPTADGVIPTLAIEGYREGIDDIRYATLLVQLIATHKSGPRKTVARNAGIYLASLDADRDLETIRLEIIGYILQLWEQQL